MEEGHKVRTYVLVYVRFWNCCVECGVKLRHKASDMYIRRGGHFEFCRLDIHY